MNNNISKAELLINLIKENKTSEALAKIAEFSPEVLTKKNREDATALWYASEKGNIDILKALLAKLPIEATYTQGPNGYTPLYIASMDGKTEIVRLLLEKIPVDKINLTDSYNNTPIFISVYRGHTEVVKALLEKMTPDMIMIKEKINGDTPLHKAIQTRNLEIITLLTDAIRPEDLKIKNKKNLTPFDIAIDGILTYKPSYSNTNNEVTGRAKFKEIADYIAGKFPSETLLGTDAYGSTKLHIASDKERANTALKLIQVLPVSSLLIKNSEDVGQNTALHIACNIAQTEIVIALLEKLATDPTKLKENLEMENKYGQIPFFMACSGRHANVTGLNIYENLVKIIAELLKYMTDDQIRFRNKHGFNAFYYICKSGLYDGLTQFIDKLLPEDFNIEGRNIASFYYACVSTNYNLKEKYQEIIKLIIDKVSKEQLVVKDENKKTPLHFVCLNNYTDIVKLLVEKLPQTELNPVNNDKETPIDYAFGNINIEIVKTILSKFSDEDIQYIDKSGNTLLQSIVISFPESEEGFELATMLLEKMPADLVTHVNNEGFTALELAIGAQSTLSKAKNEENKENEEANKVRVIDRLVELIYSKMPFVEVNNEKKREFPNFSNMAPNAEGSELGGSTGAMRYINVGGRKWVVKKGLKGVGGFLQVLNESVANDVYESFGVAVPKHLLYRKEKALVLEYIEGKLLKEYRLNPEVSNATIDEIRTKLCADFIFDALLANWDVIGLEYDNIIIRKDTTDPVRIDNGGTFMYRAQGTKDPSKFTSEVREIFTMRDPTVSVQASEFFGELSNKELVTQIGEKIVTRESYEDVLALVHDKSVKKILKDRMDFLISIYNLQTTLDLEDWTNYGKNVRTDIPVRDYSDVIKPIPDELLSYLDIMAIRFYTGKDYTKINMFLYKKSDRGAVANGGARKNKYRSMIKISGGGRGYYNNYNNYNNDYNNYPTKYSNNYDNPPYNPRELPVTDYIHLKVDVSVNDPTYNDVLMFYYITYLYNIIKKGPKMTETPFIVYRSTKTWYLDKSTERFSYISSFTSTSLSKDVALNFGGGTTKIYKFYVHPDCKYINVSKISTVVGEEEALFQPFIRCMFVREEEISGVDYQSFVIIPTDMISEFTFDEFIRLRDSVPGGVRGRSIRYNTTRKLLPKKMKVVNQLVGLPRLLKQKNRLRTHRIKKMVEPVKKPLLNKTMKNGESNNRRRTLKKDVVTPDHDVQSIYSRFNEPLHTFKGKEPTVEEKKMIEQITGYFSK